MPKTKKPKRKVEKKPCTWPGCTKLIDPRGEQSHLLKHQRQEEEKFEPQKPEIKEEELKKVQELQADPNLPTEQKENLGLMEGALINETEEAKIKKLKEGDIQIIQQTNREKRAQLQDQQLTQQLSQFQGQDPNSLSIKDLLELRKIEALSGNKDNSSNVAVQNQLSMQKDLFDFKLAMIQEVQKIRDDKKTSFEEFNKFQEMAEKFASRMGYKREVGEEGGAWDYISKMASENIPKLINLGEKRMGMAQQGQTYQGGQPQQIPQPEQPLPENSSMPKGEESIAPPTDPQEVEKSVAPMQQNPQNPQQSTASQMTDEQVSAYAKKHYIGESMDDSQNFMLDMYLEKIPGSEV